MAAPIPGNPALTPVAPPIINIGVVPPKGKKPVNAKAKDADLPNLVRAVNFVDWCDPNAPAAAAQFVAALPMAPNAPFRQALGFGPGGIAGKEIPAWFIELWGGPPQRFGQALLCILWFPAYAADLFIDLLKPFGACNPARAIKLVLARAFAQFVAKYIGIQTDQVDIPIQHTLNYVCQTNFLTGSEAVDSYLHNYITLADCKGWAKGDSWCDYKTQTAIEVGQYEHSIPELYRLWDWDIITFRNNLDDRVRWHGVIAPGRAQELYDSHWTPWDVSTIYRALWELRPSKVGASVAYTDADARKDLKRLGYEPKKIDQMMLLAHTPIGMRQILQPYYEGDVSDNTLVSTLMDIGITASDIQELFAFYRRKKDEQQRQDVGAPKPAQMVKAVAAGDMVPNDLVSEMQAQGARQDQIEDAVAEIQTILAEDNRTDGIAAIKGRFMSGEDNAAEAAVALGQFAVDPQLARALVNRWGIELSHRHTPLSQGQLCDMTTRGMMSVSEYGQRLQKMGFDAVDVERIIRVCGLKEEEKTQKQEEVNRKRREAEQAKRLAAQQKQAAKEDAARAKAEAAHAKLTDKERAQLEKDRAKADHARLQQELKIQTIKERAKEKRLAALEKARIKLAEMRLKGELKGAGKAKPTLAQQEAAKVEKQRLAAAESKLQKRLANAQGNTPSGGGNAAVSVNEVWNPTSSTNTNGPIGTASQQLVQPLESSGQGATVSQGSMQIGESGSLPSPVNPQEVNPVVTNVADGSSVTQPAQGSVSNPTIGE